MHPLLIVLFALLYLSIGAGVLTFLVTVFDEDAFEGPGAVLVLIGWPVLLGIGIPAVLIMKTGEWLGNIVRRKFVDTDDKR